MQMVFGCVDVIVGFLFAFFDQDLESLVAQTGDGSKSVVFRTKIASIFNVVYAVGQTILLTPFLIAF